MATRPPPLISLMLTHFGAGAAAGLGLLVGLVALDAHGLHGAIAGDASTLLVGSVAALLFGGTFGTVAASAGVMLLTCEPEDGGRGRPAPLAVARAAPRPMDPR